MNESNMKDAQPASPATASPQERQWAMFALLTLGIGALVTVPLLAIIFITAFVIVIIAAIKANEGLPTGTRSRCG